MNLCISTFPHLCTCDLCICAFVYLCICVFMYLYVMYLYASYNLVKKIKSKFFSDYGNLDRTLLRIIVALCLAYNSGVPRVYCQEGKTREINNRCGMPNPRRHSDFSILKALRIGFRAILTSSLQKFQQ